MEQPEFAVNEDLMNIHTPVKGSLLVKYLIEAGYDPREISFLESGFSQGFDIEYHGPTNRTSKASNIPLKVGTPVTLWNKLIKEVKLKRVTGPFDSVPFKYFIQSPIGLVPKTGGQTRLIFHLSFKFGPDEKSVNYHTPAEKCLVKYQDLDEAIRNCCHVRVQNGSHELVLVQR